LNKATDETVEPISTRNISKSISPREVHTFGGQNNNCTILGGPILEFWDPPDISRTVEARNFTFGK